MSRFFAKFLQFSSIIWVCCVNQTDAHPAHAEPVEYPFVIGFERFYSGDDDPAYLTEGGHLLLNELNCVACHSPPAALAEQFTGRKATRLQGTGSRLPMIDLELMIRNPRFVKRDTIMPSVFAGPDRDLDEIEALKHFLASLNEKPQPLAAKGDPDEGRRLYHRLGCVACHAPELGYVPDDLLKGLQLELVGLPSMPMNLADRYDETALARFLLDPLQHRPSGRMPETFLTEQEAAHIARYLKNAPVDALPPRLSDALGEQQTFEIDPVLLARGKSLFFEKNCVACHDASDANISKTEAANYPIPPKGPPLIALHSAGRSGCLSEKPVAGGIPAYFLDTVQVRAIELALAELSSGPPAPPTVKERVDFDLMALNCYACHERGGKGGLEYAREPYFSFDDPKAIDLGRQAYVPPNLDATGRKFKPTALKSILTSHRSRIRPWLSARMPTFSPQHVENLRKHLFEADVANDSIPLKNGDAASGKELFSALDCAACHGTDNEKPARLPGVNLTESVKRLTPEFFHDYLAEPWKFQPDTIMPEIFKDRNDADQEIADLWQFLSQPTR